MFVSSQSALIITAIVAAGIYVDLRRKWKARFRGHRLPPGPHGWPIVGCLLDLPTCERPWTAYREWAHKYGELSFCSVPS